MKIRLGYACVSQSLDVTSSSLITYTQFLKEQNIDRLYSVIEKNLINLEKIIDYNIANDIYFFRLSSKLIPLATKDDVIFDYIDKFNNNYKSIANKIKDMRIDFHPDQYTVLNSVKSEVVENSIKNLEYHFNILEALRIKNKIILIHIGSSVFGKDNSLSRFVNNFEKLDVHLKNSLAIENDDKVYTAIETLELCEKINVPMILDYHHYICNNGGEEILDLLPRIFNTWKNKKMIPKVHFSSPKSKLKKEFRSHHDYIDVNAFLDFIFILKEIDQDVDIMLEAKAKDEALFRLVRLLKYKGLNITKNEIIL